MSGIVQRKPREGELKGELKGELPTLAGWGTPMSGTGRINWCSYWEEPHLPMGARRVIG